MHRTQRTVAILQAIGDDAHRPHVKQLIKGQRFFLHLAPDAVDMFRTAIDFSAHALFDHLFAQITDEVFDVLLTVNTPLVQ